MNSKQIF